MKLLAKTLGVIMICLILYAIGSVYINVSLSSWWLGFITGTLGVIYQNMIDKISYKEN